MNKKIRNFLDFLCYRTYLGKKDDDAFYIGWGRYGYLYIIRLFNKDILQFNTSEGGKMKKFWILMTIPAILMIALILLDRICCIIALSWAVFANGNIMEIMTLIAFLFSLFAVIKVLSENK